jgi:predicted alpha/beta hydrolase
MKNGKTGERIINYGETNNDKIRLRDWRRWVKWGNKRERDREEIRTKQK